MLTIGPRRRPSTASMPDAEGTVSGTNHQVCRPRVAGAGSPVSPVRRSAPTATMTAAACSASAPATSTSTPAAPGRRASTRCSSRISAPAERARAASCAGRAWMPSVGSPGVPSRNMRTSHRTKASEVSKSPSARTPLRNGSTTSARSGPRSPARSHPCLTGWSCPSAARRCSRAGASRAGAAQRASATTSDGAISPLRRVSAIDSGCRRGSARLTRLVVLAPPGCRRRTCTPAGKDCSPRAPVSAQRRTEG